MHFTSQKGFTLIELLIVVFIIGILIAVAIPQYELAVDKAEFMQMITDIDAVKKAEEVYFQSKGDYSRNLDHLYVNLRGYELDTTNTSEVMYKNLEHPGQYIQLKGAIYRQNDDFGDGRKTAANIFAKSARSQAMYYVYLDQAYRGNGENRIFPNQEKRQCVAYFNHPRSQRLCKSMGTPCDDKLIPHPGRSYCITR
jgi:prepilin-type N-terminal cleavage/methylation domain-containing protein